jgi:hypothetical protein
MPASSARAQWPGGQGPPPVIGNLIKRAVICWLNGQYAFVTFLYGQAGAMNTPNKENLPDGSLDAVD